jgi:hypothetical protein
LLQQPWYLWSLVAMAGLMSVANLTELIATYFSDTVDSPASHHALCHHHEVCHHLISVVTNQELLFITPLYRPPC